MNANEWISVWGIALSLSLTVVLSLVAVAFKLGALSQSLRSLQQVALDIPKIKYSYGQLSVKVDLLWRHNLSQSNSPLFLNENGIRLLKASGVAVFADSHYDEILLKVKQALPQNPYQAQEALLSIVNSYQDRDKYKTHLQDGAYRGGADVTAVLYVAALYLRDRIVADLGFDETDIEQLNFLTA